LLQQERNNPGILWLLSVMSGVLFWLAWPPTGMAIIAFFAFVPWLAMQDRLEKDYQRPGFLTVALSFVTFMVWNALTTWWVCLATVGGGIAAMILNSLLMTLPVFFYQRIRKTVGKTMGYIALICFWLTFEYMHLNWDAPWPWLNIGNVFAANRNWIQWYEYTGTMGGTLWVWIVNILLYEALAAGMPRVFGRKTNQKAGVAIPGFMAVMLIAIPIIISYMIKPANAVLNSKGNIVVVQPNIDPYNEKFDKNTFRDQVNTLINLSEKAIDSNTELVAWPETAIAEDMNEENILVYPSIQQVKAFIRRHPQIKLITGTNSYSIYSQDDKLTPTARPLQNGEGHFDVFNSALLLDTSPGYVSYHKSKLVPGVEKMPYPEILGPLASIAIDEGGPSGSLGSSDSPVVFHISDKLRTAPVICYESVFGEYVTGYIRRGANIITIITNDGWWGHTAGYKQHLIYGALRAIETRTFIARSANTGVSAFILPNGEILQATKFWEPAVIKSKYVVNNVPTFYVKHGDFIARWALLPSALLFLLSLAGPGIAKRFRKRRYEG
jgi:apolipoprotein N-acyltransferase